MRPIRGTVFLGAFVVLLTAGDALQAAWNNVFQVCCHRDRVSVSNFAPGCNEPCPTPCQPPQPVCTTRYVQRCYYQPVTSYKRRTYYEPVTRYRTSYYYEPVTSYRYTCAYDPCTCSYRQVAKPCTSYRLRSRCNAVTSYLQRCQLVPVTSYRQMTYYQAVTDCCDPCTGQRTSQQPSVGTQPPVTTQPPITTQPPPRVGEQGGEPPRVGEQRLPGDGGSSRFPTVPNNYRRSTQEKRPKVRMDRITSLPSQNVQGQVIPNRADRHAARLIFVSADREGVQKSVTARSNGEFATSLAGGSWLVYLREQSTGRPIYQTKINVEDNRVRQVRLVSR